MNFKSSLFGKKKSLFRKENPFAGDTGGLLSSSYGELAQETTHL